METAETKHWCSLHGGWHDDKQYAQRFGRCRSCHNHYMAWRAKQVKANLPAGIEDYRTWYRIEKKPRPRAEVLTECSVCMKRPRERGVFCRGCHNAYTAWSTKVRHHAEKNNRPVVCTIEEFQLAVDQGWVVPRHEGEAHYGGRVVRQI